MAMQWDKFGQGHGSAGYRPRTFLSMKALGGGLGTGGSKTGSGGGPAQQPQGYGQNQPGTSIRVPSGGMGINLQSPGDWFNWRQSAPHLKETMERRWLMPEIYWGNTPGKLGVAQMTSRLQDPYALPPGMSEGLLEGTELAHNRAGRQAARVTKGSGAGEGGVAEAARGDIELARGAAQARNLRELAQFATQQGDQVLQSLLLPWLQLYNQMQLGAMEHHRGIESLNAGKRGEDKGGLLRDLGGGLLNFGLSAAEKAWGKKDSKSSQTA